MIGRVISLNNIAAVPEAHSAGPLCNDCKHYDARDMGNCTRPALPRRCIDARSPHYGCGPQARFFEAASRQENPHMLDLHKLAARLARSGWSVTEIASATGLTLDAIRMLEAQGKIKLHEIHESPSNRDVSAGGEASEVGAPQGNQHPPQANTEAGAEFSEPAGREGPSAEEAGPDEPEPAAVGNPASTANSNTDEQSEVEADKSTPSRPVSPESDGSFERASRPRGAEAAEPQMAAPVPSERLERPTNSRAVPNGVTASVNCRGKIVSVSLTCLTQIDADKLFALLEQRAIDGTLLSLLEVA